MSTEYRSRKCLLNLSFFKVLMIVFYTDYIYKTTTGFGPFLNMTLQYPMCYHRAHRSPQYERLQGYPSLQTFPEIKANVIL